MIAAAIYRRDINKDAAAVGTFFETQMGRPYHEWWTWATQSLVYLNGRSRSQEELTGLEALVQLAEQRCPSFPPWLPDYRRELEAALWWRLGEAYRDTDDPKTLGWYEKALTRLEKHAALSEDAAEVALKAASKLYEEHKYREILTFLDRAIELDPNYVYAYSNRGVIYGELKEYQQAILDLDRAIELDPTLVGSYNNRGWAYNKLKEYQLAIRDLDRAIELDPNYPTAYHNRGLAYLRLKNIAQARADYERSYELDATAIRSAWMAEWVNMSRQRIDTERVAQLETIAAIDPESYEACICRGIASGLRGKGKEGLEEVEHAITLSPEDWDAYFWKGMLSAYYQQGRSHGQEVVTTIEQALSKGLPPLLLIPLYWLEKDRPAMFVEYVKPLLLRYDV
jgi:tetratricopeptide (TPR) repeat protein